MEEEEQEEEQEEEVMVVVVIVVDHSVITIKLSCIFLYFLPVYFLLFFLYICFFLFFFLRFISILNIANDSFLMALGKLLNRVQIWSYIVCLAGQLGGTYPPPTPLIT